MKGLTKWAMISPDIMSSVDTIRDSFPASGLLNQPSGRVATRLPIVSWAARMNDMATE